jgi:hypothetical protein
MGCPGAFGETAAFFGALSEVIMNRHVNLL